MHLKEERKQKRGHFRANEAARILTSKVPTATRSDTAQEVRERITDPKRRWDFFGYVYILDDRGRLIGICSVKELFRAPKSRIMSACCGNKLTVVHPHSTIQSATAKAIRQKVKAIPVIDHDGTFLGIIPIEEMLAELEHDHIKAFLRHAGVAAEFAEMRDIFSAKITDLFRWRIPWLIIGTVGGLLSAGLVRHFEAELSRVIELAFFIPAVVYIGDAIGTQSQLLFLKGISTDTSMERKYLWKDFVANLLIGGFLGALFCICSLIILNHVTVSLVVGISIFLTSASAGLIATGICRLLMKLKKDPSFGSGPLATILQDLASLFIYFAVAAALLK